MIQAFIRSITFIQVLISLGQTVTVLLPSSTGPCDVTLHTSELVDMSRTNPYHDPKGDTKRAIMVTTFTPFNCGSLHSTSYIPNATAKFEDENFGLPPGTFESLRIQTRAQQQLSLFTSRLHRDYPVVLFSPALATSRLMYTLLLQEIASHGFAVVSVDHPYDADIVEYPDGRTVLGRLTNISTEAEFDSALNIRVKEMVFLLDKMHDKKVIRDLFPLSQGNPHLLSLDRVTILGHSLGGATAAQTILDDNRFVGGINLDGELWGSVKDKGLSSPFLLFGHANHSQETELSWTTFLSHSRGWKLELELAQSEHYTFSDFPMLVDALSVSDEVRRSIQDNSTGTIGGLRAKDVITSYTIAALQKFVYGHESELLSGPSAAYPDVKFVSR